MRHIIRAAAVLMAASVFTVLAPAARAAKAAIKPGAVSVLNLSKAQQQKLLSLHKKAQAEVTAVEKSKATDAQKRQKIQAIARKYDALEAKVLTPAQRKKLQSIHEAERKGQERMASVIKSLTPTQRKQIEGFRAAFFSKVKALDADKKMTRAQKEARFMSLQKELGVKVDSVLSARQKAMLKGK